MTEIVRKLHREETTKVLWQLKGWDHAKRDELALEHLENESCCVDVGTTDGSPAARLRFLLKKSRDNRSEMAIDSDGVIHRVDNPHLDLCVEQLFNVDNQIATFHLKGTLVDEQFKPVNKKSKLRRIPDSRIESDSGCNQLSLHHKFVRLHFGYFASRRPANLRIKLFVKCIFSPDHAQTTVLPSIRLSRALDQMFTSDKSYAANIKLETKDGETLSVCQLLLAARSPVLRSIIVKELDSSEFSGTIKLDVNAEPMKVILHWIYTGKLPENAGECIREVVEAGIKFCIEGLLDTLDRGMIAFCNPQNMFLLYQIALKNSMGTATAEVSQFIRNN